MSGQSEAAARGHGGESQARTEGASFDDSILSAATSDAVTRCTICFLSGRTAIPG